MDSPEPAHNKAEAVVPDKRSLAIPTRTLDPPITGLVDMAREIELADELIQSHVGGKLDIILNQIRHLKSEARLLLEQAERDRELHRVECGFQKVIGQEIFLYERPDGRRYFTLLSPEDWGGAPPNRFCGAYRLNADRSFAPTRAA